jgi:hypothetical protein
MLLFLLNSSLSIGQWYIKSGAYHDFLSIKDDNSSIKWNQANGVYIGGDYIFDNQIIIASSLNYYKINRRLNSTYNSLNNQTTTTFFHGKIDYLALDLSFGYSFNLNESSSLQLKLGVAHFVKLKTTIIESYKKIQNFDSSNDEDKPYLTTKTFFNGTSDYDLDRSFIDRLLDIRLMPSINLNYRYSFSEKFSLDIFSQYTLFFGYRIGAGVVYKLNQNKGDK